MFHDEHPRVASVQVADLIGHLYLKLGKDMVTLLRGDHSYVIYDSKQVSADTASDAKSAFQFPGNVFPLSADSQIVLVRMVLSP